MQHYATLKTQGNEGQKMKVYNTKRGAQNQATRLNKIESANNTLKFWEVELTVLDSKLGYFIYDCSNGIQEIWG